MLEHAYLQTGGAAIVGALILAIIICVIFYVVQKRSINSSKQGVSLLRQEVSLLRQQITPLSGIDPKIQYDVTRIQADLQNAYADITKLKTDLPHTNEVSAVQENMKKLCNDFTDLKDEIGSQVNKIHRNTAENMTKTKEQMIKTAEERITEHAVTHLTKNSISREEFEALKNKIERVLGADEVAERTDMLSSIFDSTQIKTITWQCKLIKLLDGGLAPDAEEDLILSQGIPRSTCERFLKKLRDAGIVDSKKIQAFYLANEYEWLYSYVENPDGLSRMLESRIKKEREYQKYVESHLNLVEDGLLLEAAEYKLATGPIDFICRDTSGRAVGLELKYPSATPRDKRQIMGYRSDYVEKTGRRDSRFILVAPKISTELKDLLAKDGLEYREIDF